MNNSKKYIIDGLPTSYDHNYVLKTNKRCFLCHNKILLSDLELNNTICTEDFDFAHKYCLDTNELEIVFAKKNDFTSMIKLKRKINKIEYVCQES